MYITANNAMDLLGTNLYLELRDVLYTDSIHNRYAENIVSTLQNVGEFDLAKKLERRRVEYVRSGQLARRLRDFKGTNSQEAEDIEEEITELTPMDARRPR